MNKHTYTATRPDGKIETRTTERTYTHVLIAHWENATDGSYTRVEWCGRLDLAQKAYKKYNKPGVNVTLTIIPVDNPREVIIGTAGVSSPAAPEPQKHETFFTETKLTIDGEKINARISWDTVERQWLIEVLANGMALVNETDRVAQKHIAALTADDMVNNYVQRVFLGRRKHVRFSPVATISLKK